MNELVTVNNDSGLDRSERISANLAIAKERLLDTKTDIERMEIRDFARKYYKVAVAIELNEIAVESANLIQFTERKIVEANPPESSVESGSRGGNKEGVTPSNDLVTSGNLRRMRQAHTDISDNEFNDLQQGAVDSGEPLTRSKLQEIVKDKKRNQNRVERDIKLESNNTQLPDGTQKYGIIYADPPWRYDFSNTSNREIENHYPTMELQEIKDLGVPDICHDDCVLYLWATSAKAPEAFEVMTSWGFTYKSQFVWVKNKIGMGYWARNQHELLLIGTKGKFPPPEPENRISSVINEVRTEHSVKPISVAKMIEANYPNVAKIEMFSRQSRDGWDAFGNESTEMNSTKKEGVNHE